MADYNTELSQSGLVLFYKPADGFERSTKFGLVSGDTHQFTGSVYISGALHANEYRVITITTASGSTFFGNDSGDTHTFTGSILQTGSGGTNYFRDSNVFGPTDNLHQFTGSVAVTGNVRMQDSLHLGAAAAYPGSPTLDVYGDSNLRTNTKFGSTVGHIASVTGAIKQWPFGLGLLKNEFKVSNTFGHSDGFDDHQFTGSVFADGAMTAESLITTFGGLGNPTTLSASVVIPTYYNYCLVGPLHLSGGVSVTIVGTGNFKIL